MEIGHIMGKFQNELVEQFILRKNIEELKDATKAVDCTEEEFEKAAEVRDEIRST